MSRPFKLWLCAACMTGVLNADAFGGRPVFSLGVVAINSTPVPGGFTRHVQALPGDVLTLKVYLRNWSPSGERLNAYQMQLETLDFQSGSGGSIKPVDYETARENNTMNLANCFVDQSDPEWLFVGRQSITLTDTRSPAYRWMSVLVDTADALLCDDPDKMFYAGTVKMKVSDDARGTFTLGFMEVETSSLLLDEHGVLISPLEFENLTVVIRPDILGVIDRLNGDQQVAVERVDMDGNGEVSPADITKALDVLNGTTAEPEPAEATTAE
ncbi:MAG: hypothetical protein ACE5HE_06030 [Phycisphaerae bacterium]